MSTVQRRVLAKVNLSLQPAWSSWRTDGNRVWIGAGPTTAPSRSWIAACIYRGPCVAALPMWSKNQVSDV
ncbi:hypothetical protein, partial [Sphingomonas koreensis]|uniref:hypothetical protein n=1 Tax=Sphingomonas koreensis TaxID=93064 RepID=UPI0019D2D4BA